MVWRVRWQRTAGVLGLALIALLGARSASRGEEGVQLAFKFAPGEVMAYEVSLSGAGHLESSEGDVAPVGVQGSFSVVCRVAEAVADGGGRLEARLPKAKMSVSIGDEHARFSYENGRLRWFANGKEHAPPETDLRQLPLLGTPVVFTMAPNGRVSEVTLADARALGALAQAAPAMGLGRIEQAGEQIFPDEPVAVGETWRRSAQLLPFGPTMPITITTSRTLDSFSEEGGTGLAKISGYSEARVKWRPVTVSPGEAEVRVGVPELRKTITSTEFFDTISGRLVRADYDVALSTRVSVGVGGEEREGGAEARFHIVVQAR